MKHFFLLMLGMTLVLLASAQDDKKPVSPPATATGQSKSGASITINYSQPSVKGRTIGKDLEPMDGQVWRAGANKATVFEVSKDVKVEGKDLPAGKYAFFTTKNGDDWTLIFNKTSDQWGAYKYNKDEDALQVTVKGSKAPSFAETLTYSVGADGKVSLLWGDHAVAFTVD